MVLSWNIFIGFCILVSVLYGFILQRNKIILTLLNVYIAVAVVDVVGPGFNSLIQNVGGVLLNESISDRLFSMFLTQTFLFVAIIILMSVRAEHAKAMADVKVMHPLILSFVYSVFFALIVCSTIMSFLAPEVQASINSQSTVIAWIMARQSWWIVLPVILMIVTSYFIIPEED
ncbi:MAG: hypothetical protein WC570_01455 [Patescibacteria group bacterium]